MPTQKGVKMKKDKKEKRKKKKQEFRCNYNQI